MQHMEAAIITGVVAVLLWALSRVPGFSAAARLTSSIERDLRILRELPDGQARDEWKSIVESQVLELAELRRPSRERSAVVRMATGSPLSLVVARAGAFVLVASTVWMLPRVRDDQNQDLELGAWSWVGLAVILLLTIGMVVATVAQEREFRRDVRRLDDFWEKRRRRAAPDEAADGSH